MSPSSSKLITGSSSCAAGFVSPEPWVGWAVGAFEGGCTTAWLAGEKQFPTTAILAVLLVLAGIFDMVLIGFPMLSMILGVLILAVFPFLGRHALNTFERKKREKMAGKGDLV